MRLGKGVLMDHHTVNHKDTGLLFLSLKPQLRKYTEVVTKKGINWRNDLWAEVSRLPTATSTRN